ncbi:MAG: DUF4276 family protein [Prevotella sp.]|nr:DUF4276 family protein [Prevotella sp.]
MKRLVFIVEGETEEAFVNTILRPYFQGCGLYNPVQCFKIKHTQGGMHKYSYVRNDVLNTIYEHDVIVTTMFDLYALPHSFPGYEESQTINDHLKRVEFLEAKMKEDLELSQNRQFNNYIPYIQLHEFEALVFSSPNGFEALFEDKEMNFKGIREVIDTFPNPEDINDSPETAPSKRMQKLIQGYNKVTYGVSLIEYTGIGIILKKCPHFKDWIEKLKVCLVKIKK